MQIKFNRDEERNRRSGGEDGLGGDGVGTGEGGFGEAEHGGGDGFRGHGLPGAEEADGVEGLEDCDAGFLAEAVAPLADERRGLKDEAAGEAEGLDCIFKGAFHPGVEYFGF